MSGYILPPSGTDGRGDRSRPRLRQRRGGRPRPDAGSTWPSAGASSSRSRAGRVAARRRCSTSSAASTGRRPAGWSSTAPRSPTMGEAELVQLRRRIGGLHLPGVRPRPDPQRGRERRDPAPAGQGRPARARSARPGPARARRARRARPPPAVRAVGRRAAAGGDRPRARQRARSSCSPTSRPVSSTSETGHTIMTLLRSIVRTEGVTAVVAHPRPGDARRRRPGRRLRDGRLFDPSG